MTKETAHNLAGVIHEMSQELALGKDYKELQLETAAFLRKNGYVNEARELLSAIPRDFNRAHGYVVEEQSKFD